MRCWCGAHFLPRIRTNQHTYTRLIPGAGWAHLKELSHTRHFHTSAPRTRRRRIIVIYPTNTKNNKSKLTIKRVFQENSFSGPLHNSHLYSRVDLEHFRTGLKDINLILLRRAGQCVRFASFYPEYWISRAKFYKWRMITQKWEPVVLLLQHLFQQAAVPPCKGRIRWRNESSWGAAAQGDELQGEEAIVRWCRKLPNELFISAKSTWESKVSNYYETWGSYQPHSSSTCRHVRRISGGLSFLTLWKLRLSWTS